MNGLHITLLGGFDRRLPSAGGVRSYVESLERFLDSVGVPHLTVLSGPEWDVGEDWCTVPVIRSGSTAHMQASMSANFKRLPIPENTIVHAQRPDYLLPFLLGGIASKWVCTFHGNPFEGMRQTRNPAVFAAYAFLEAVVLHKTARAIFVDVGSATQYFARYPWARAISEVIPNGIDTAVFRPTDRAAEKRRWGFWNRTFLYAGRLEPEKRVVEIVQAFRKLGMKNCELIIAGDGSQRSAVEEYARGANVRFLGPVRRSEMPSLMNAADAVVMYSLYEGLPSTVLEALACGTPVLATPVGALPDVVKDGENGHLVSSQAELVEGMRSVCLDKIVASDSVSKAVEPYSWSILGPRVLQVYEFVQQLAERRSRR